MQSSKTFLGTVLKALKVKKSYGSDWIDLEPEAGQSVVVGERHFTLVLCMLIGRSYRIWMTADDGCCTAQAKDVDRVIPLSGKDKETALRQRLEVVTCFIVDLPLYCLLYCV